MWYFVKLVWKNCREAVPISIVLVLCRLAFQLCDNYKQKYIVEFVLEPEQTGILAVILLLLVVSGLSLLLIEHMNFSKNHAVYFRFRNYMLDSMMEKCMTTDYENIENAKNGDLFQKANQANAYLSGGMLGVLEDAAASLLGITAFSAILAALNPALIFMILFPAVAGYYINRHKIQWVWKMADNWQVFERQLEYMIHTGSEFGHAKDVRLFGMQRWFSDINKRCFKKRLLWYEQQDAWERRHDIFSYFVQAFGNFAVYGYLIYKVMQGETGAGDFVLYMNAAGSLSFSVRDWCDKFSSFHWLSKNVEWLRQYGTMQDRERKLLPEQYADHNISSELETHSCKEQEQEYEIEFCNVSYTYHGAKEPTIKNLSFTLHKGEKLALVGPNGAGKTTIVKLLCGLYDPTEGEIRLNGLPAADYPRKQYFKLFSTVFQDIELLPATIAENVAGSPNPDKERVQECLKRAGLYEKVQSLPQKEAARLVKSVYDGATDFSGGQIQKLALAKALYKDAPVLLLDEPTAALDPIAEQEMYQEYTNLSRAKCSLFISHRLASTRFCDRILYLEQGRIAEEGTHAALMQAEGSYAKLYHIQSSYYIK